MVASVAFVRAVEAIYDAAAAPDEWPRTLQVIADCFGDVGAVLMWQRDDGSFGTIVSPSLLAAQKDYVENQWYLRDVPAQYLMQGAYLSSSDTLADADHISQEVMESHPYYTEFSARHGIRWRMGIAVAPDPRIAVWIALQRGPDKSPHSEAEHDMAAQLGRHVEKCLRLSIRLLDAELANLGLGEALLRVGVGVFALDSRGRVVFSNPAAERLVGDQIDITNGVLHLGTGSRRNEIDSMLGRLLQGSLTELLGDIKPILLHGTRSNRPLVVYFLPVTPPKQSAALFLTNTRVIVLVIDSEANGPADPAVVRDALGLTLGEARVAALVGTGLPPRDAAAKLGIAEETARSTLKRVFSKLGVSRQSELSALLARIVLR
jgi:DNA-binding CsgD family transcriptional regulator/PAS domain-containing protein